jgi:hypothetical protein
VGPRAPAIHRIGGGGPWSPAIHCKCGWVGSRALAIHWILGLVGPRATVDIVVKRNVCDPGGNYTLAFQPVA